MMYNSKPRKSVGMPGFVPPFQMQGQMAKAMREGSVDGGSQRGSYSGTNVHHLEIPAELAYVYSKLDGKNVFQFI